ncbi:MAG: hypothetical protein HZB51_13600 [Chloroflexi bacterium]|nr:hypothetical protein [Chloroflexota bacterium]
MPGEFPFDPMNGLLEAFFTFVFQFVAGWLIIAVMAFAIQAARDLIHVAHGNRR